MACSLFLYLPVVEAIRKTFPKQFCLGPNLITIHTYYFIKYYKSSSSISRLFNVIIFRDSMLLTSHSIIMQSLLYGNKGHTLPYLKKFDSYRRKFFCNCLKILTHYSSIAVKLMYQQFIVLFK